MIKSFYRGVEKKKLKLSIMGTSEVIYQKAVDKLMDVFETDRYACKSGRLYFNDQYLRCYVKGVKPEEWEAGNAFMDVELIFAVEYPAWITEKEYVFSNQASSETKDAFKYPFRYPFRYPTPTDGIIYQLNATSSEFILALNGPATNPVVKIGKYRYGVIDKLADGEYVIINSQEGYVRKYSNNSQSYTNIYDKRLRENDIFQKIDTGTVEVTWPGSFHFSLTVIGERSFPKWHSQSLTKTEKILVS